MAPYVGDWSQEVYGDVRDYAVAGASPATRASYLNDYLQHQLALADAAPAEAAAAAFLHQTYAPLANAAWIWSSAYGYTNVDEPTMADFVSGHSLGLRILRSGAAYASGTFATSSTGGLTMRVYAPRGCYSTTITSLAASGYAWDGATPSNRICF